MEPNFQTSFIPKKPIVERHSAGMPPIGVFTIISIFILFTVALAIGGLYFYKEFLTRNIVKMENDLNLAKNRFEPAKITELQILDRRLRASSEILSKHIAVTPIFQALQAITMKTVRFTNFSYAFGEDNNTGSNGSLITVKMKGFAVGYRSVALQSDLFTTKEEAKNFIDPIFSNLTLDDKGNVLFDLEFSVAPSFVDYKQMLSTEEEENEDLTYEDLTL